MTRATRATSSPRGPAQAPRGAGDAGALSPVPLDRGAVAVSPPSDTATCSNVAAGDGGAFLEHFAALRAKGLTVKQIAARHGMTLSGLKKKVVRLRKGLGIRRVVTSPDARAEVIRCIQTGSTIREAAASAGVTYECARSIAKRAGVHVSREAIAREVKRGAEMTKARKRKPAEPTAERAGPNPFRTEAQNAQIDRHKNRMWGHNPKLARLPPVTQDEAARLVADHIARRGVTVCPPAAEREIPNNAGAPWR